MTSFYQKENGNNPTQMPSNQQPENAGKNGTVYPLAFAKGIKHTCELCQKIAYRICEKCRVTYYWLVFILLKHHDPLTLINKFRFVAMRIISNQTGSAYTRKYVSLWSLCAASSRFCRQKKSERSVQMISKKSEASSSSTLARWRKSIYSRATINELVQAPWPL